MSPASVIGAGTVVRGNVEGEGSLELFGRVEGDVSMSGDVLVAEGASVLGSISAAKISVLGAVQGDLRGSEAVLVERGARVVGDLSAPRIGISAGGLVRGNVRTEGEPSAAAQRRPVAAAPVAHRPPQVALSPKPPQVAPAPLPAREVATTDAVHLVARSKEPERRPPPPVLPSLGKGAKGKKKKDRDSDD
ncbi:MAG TPA: polymer-forming cytoskeletal protein [Polyangiaceae bacterium]|nr:polymer-forming cytoskeletal protein [Polyangiaceae bacterium]